ncbi:hypothetical protein N5J53_16265 [Empedobacter sp. GD03644]|uniref:DUF3226 domain-containing protein n=1 Tax=Empedobacter sp. GD03644 TaxID=2975358 RepID=UPI002448150A|nr:DUF3226 domain-containing protein [Empedobacter sp. GD03644]MDH2208564.1 hypothetical protein [Empedobacter sp. GD03644]
MKRIISILCEGPHDVAFITKILKSSGFTNNEKLKLSEYPEPINNLLINEATNTKVEDLNIQEVRQSLLPSSTLQKGDDIYLFLFSLGGDSKSVARIDYLRKLSALIPTEEGEIDPFPEIELGLIYFFDADNEGISSRIQKINEEIKKVIQDIDLKKDDQIKSFKRFKIGCYIFAEADTNLGNLENIVLPIMRHQNETIFDDAEKFLDQHYMKERCKSKFDKSKSIIGLCGQLQKSGSSNVVCISQSDYLNDEKIHQDSTCNSIIEFIDSFTK